MPLPAVIQYAHVIIYLQYKICCMFARVYTCMEKWYCARVFHLCTCFHHSFSFPSTFQQAPPLLAFSASLRAPSDIALIHSTEAVLVLRHFTVGCLLTREVLARNDHER